MEKTVDFTWEKFEEYVSKLLEEGSTKLRENSGTRGE